MMTNTELKEIMYQEGRRQALDLQSRAPSMTGTELNAADDHIPWFTAACKKANMLTRPIGFVCKSSAGRVVRLNQPYDSEIYTAEPEELTAQWGFVWSDDPAKAKPFIASAESPYAKGNCCAENGGIYRSLEDGNIFAPSAYPTWWEYVGPA